MFHVLTSFSNECFEQKNQLKILSGTSFQVRTSRNNARIILKLGSSESFLFPTYDSWFQIRVKIRHVFPHWRFHSKGTGTEMRQKLCCTPYEYIIMFQRCTVMCSTAVETQSKMSAVISPLFLCYIGCFHPCTNDFFFFFFILYMTVRTGGKKMHIWAKSVYNRTVVISFLGCKSVKCIIISQNVKNRTGKKLLIDPKISSFSSSEKWLFTICP